jgi:hypothetical protein
LPIFTRWTERRGSIIVSRAFAGCRRRLAAKLEAARADPEGLPRKDESTLLIALGPHLEDFLGVLFGIEGDVLALEQRHHELAPLYAVKRQFVQRKAMNTHRAEAAAAFDGPALRRELERELGAPFSELGFAEAVTRWQQDDAATRPRSTWRCATPRGRPTRRKDAPAHKAACCSGRRASSTSCSSCPSSSPHVNGVDAWQIPSGHVRRRQGFALTDPGWTCRAPSISRTTASGATSKARIPARTDCSRSRPPARRLPRIPSRRARSA